VSPPPHCPGTYLCDNPGVKDEALRPSFLLKSPPQVVHPSLTVPLPPEETDSRLTLLVISVILIYILAQTIRLIAVVIWIIFSFAILINMLKSPGLWGLVFLYIYICILYFCMGFCYQKTGAFCWGEGVMRHAISITGCLSYFALMEYSPSCMLSNRDSYIVPVM